jgi:hypothetical protein
MIAFNNLGHTFKLQDTEPIVWVDSSDASTYTLSGNNVLTLDNKGTLGGAMTLNGSVKFANSGFESWSASDYITRDLGEPFMTNNSFTMVTTFECSDLTSTSEKWFSTVRADVNNRMPIYFTNPNLRFRGVSSGAISDTNANFPLGYSSNVTTIVTTYDLSLNSITTISLNGSSSFTWTSRTFNNTLNSIIYLMALDPAIYGSSMGANNPLHEFRLYDRAFSLTEMQNLQTELNNKYTP